MLHGVHGTRAARPALDLVGDEHDAVFFTDGFEPGKIFRRRGHEPAFARNGLHDQTGDVRGFGIVDEKVTQLVGAGHTA